MARVKTAILATALLAGAFAATTAVAGQTTFTDTTFNTANYTLGSFSDPSVTINSYGQTLTGGDPGAALQGTVSSVGANAQGVLLTALNNTFVYNPSTSGAITSLNASLDRFTTPTNGGDASLVGSYSLRVLAEQDGQLYQATFVFGPINQPGGIWNDLVENGITASDFSTLDASNFTGAGVTGGLNFAGDAITFGFAMRGSGAVEPDGSLSTFDQTNDLRADNFDLTINSGTVPEPASWALMLVGFGAAGALLRSRRRPAFG
ncbi:PEPxxWA-CTERM sorting domain-containing protein [Phenylobacterium sp.]|uniref:PEPxxWA-CTERM sorting domain-containing protein n=1 Tax=Phenylobacterium sp. TaxID=1871053 RepID=UPI00121AA82C|nr:PEPxxWA-CTERM sorting domain-containing protein [Phenylobacterium sp.]THD64976.1 MAG: PEP-CTERM sorting domain-containing protein [Phenylobacterium sp.]